MEFKDYKLNEEIIIDPYIFEVTFSEVTNRHYLSGQNCNGHEIFKHLEVEKSSYVKNIVGHEYGGSFPEVKTLEDLNKVIRQLQIDCLIKEAKEKYPKGTDFRALYNNLYYESSGEFKWLSKEYELRDAKFSYGVIWANNRWAKIVAGNPKQPEINTYGLKVGDILKEDIISFWSARANNQYDPFSKKWHKNNTNFINSRQIESFKVFDGIVGFLISGTHELYLRAEGFKEFAEGFNKSKSAFEFEVGKWYKCEGYNYAIKYLRKEARNSKYVIVYSDIITYNYKYESSPEGNTGVGYVNEGTWYELTDLSEIQKYLPNDHPDKIKAQPEYIVGKWYRLGALIGKFRKLDGDRFCVFKSGTPSDNYKFPDGGHLSIKYQGTPVLITDMTEVYKLFPEENPTDSDLELERWYEDGDFIVYLYARNSVYGFHHDYWFESNGFNEKGLKLCHPQKVDDKFSKYIRNEYKIGDTVTCPYDQQIFKIKELDFNIRKDRIIVSASSIKKRYGFLFYQGKWAEIKSDCEILEKQSDFILKNPCAEIYNHINYPIPPYEAFSVDYPLTPYEAFNVESPIKETNSKQESTTELLLKLNNKKQKFVKLTEIKTIKL